MSESNFREIQLNTKQVVFLFMAFVVASVAVFLLGVSVGQGVASSGTTDATTSAESVAKVPVPSVMPPPTTPKPDDLKYHDELQGRGSPSPTPSAAAKIPPASTSTPKPTPTQTPEKPAPAPAPVKPVPTPTPPPSKTPPPVAGAFYVQVDSFASKDNADRQVQQLKARGFTAFVVTAPTGAARYKTRIGPFDRAAADAMKARLTKEGFRPSVIR